MNNKSHDLGQRLRELRVAKSLKQSELDQAASLPRSTVSKIENGKREATASELVRLAKVLGVTLDMLVSGATEFVYKEEIKVIEALREISFEDYQRILRTIEAQIYFATKDAGPPRKQYLQGLVSALAGLTQSDRRPRSLFENIKRVRRQKETVWT